MNKYILLVQKVEEVKKDRYSALGLEGRIYPPQTIFECEISSDGTIEILRHLYDLREKENLAK